ncbi:MAG: shikimate dehydrogenase [Chloroflexota bacterium]
MTITGSTQLIGLIGWPVAHSRSPAMHNAAAAALGLDWVYVPLPVRPQNLKTAVSALSALGFRGVNVTVPHKQAVLPLLADLDDGAQALKAVNTILVAENGRLIGHNTDWSGFQADLESQQIAVNNRDCLVLGAGGSARAVVYALARLGGRVQVLARRPQQAADLVADLQPYLSDAWVQGRPLASLPPISAQTQAPLIVNTTPLGMAPDSDQSIWPDELPFPSGSFVYDLVYNPAHTRLMVQVQKQTQAAGCRASNGLGMLLHQGAQAFALWTGQRPDLTVMAAALDGDGIS